jgi:hypothetical protein
MTNYATIESKSAPINSEFGMNFACRLFNLTPEELEAKVGRYSRGPRKGLLRGWLVWAKTTKGGWVKTGAYDHDAGAGNGFVAPANLTFAHGVFVNDALILGVDMQAPRFDLAAAMRDALLRRGGQQKAATSQQPPPTIIATRPAYPEPAALDLTHEQMNALINDIQLDPMAAPARWTAYYNDCFF